MIIIKYQSMLQEIAEVSVTSSLVATSAARHRRKQKRVQAYADVLSFKRYLISS